MADFINAFIVSYTPEVSGNLMEGINIDEYYKNRPMIIKLLKDQEAAKLYIGDQQQKLEAAKDKIHSLEIEKEKLLTKIDESKGQSFMGFGLSVVATILIGVGINIVTGNPPDASWMGWAMIVFAVVIDLLAFRTYFRKD
jgi:hypothetical protein